MFKVYYSHLPKFSAVSGYTGGHANNPCKSSSSPGLSSSSPMRNPFTDSIWLLIPHHRAWTAYREVCSGNTGHAEAVKVTWEKGSVGYGELVEFFFRTHDPTTVDRQGPDRGSRESHNVP